MQVNEQKGKCLVRGAVGTFFLQIGQAITMRFLLMERFKNGRPLRARHGVFRWLRGRVQRWCGGLSFGAGRGRFGRLFAGLLFLDGLAIDEGQFRDFIHT